MVTPLTSASEDELIKQESYFQSPHYDYAYQLSDEQLLRYIALPAGAKLRWLDEARRFTLLARGASPDGGGEAETAKKVAQDAGNSGS